MSSSQAAVVVLATAGHHHGHPSTAIQPQLVVGIIATCESSSLSVPCSFKKQAQDSASPGQVAIEATAIVDCELLNYTLRGWSLFGTIGT